jgi:hypothetical protein
MSDRIHREHSAHAHHGHGGGPLRTSAQATLHCLTGCVVGEVAGLLIGTLAGLSPWPMMILATALSYLSGITLGLVPVMRSQRVGLLGALGIIWIGEVISIGVMEVVMNFVDYQLGRDPRLPPRDRQARAFDADQGTLAAYFSRSIF